MDEIKSLRQQLGAAQFLVNSLQAQLQRAEAHFATVQQYDNRVSSASLQHGGLSNSGIDPALHGAPSGLTDGDIDDIAPLQTGLSEGSLGTHDGYGTGGCTPSTPPSPQSGEYPIPAGVILPSLAKKTIYPGLAEVKVAVEAHAMAQGWTVAIKKRDHLRIVIGCRKTPTCTYHTRAETCVGGARISAYNPVHTCINKPIVDVPKRHQISTLRFLREEVPKLMQIEQKTRPKDIQEAVFLRFGTRPSLGQCSKLKPVKRTKRSQVQTCKLCGVTGHNRLTCTGFGKSVEGVSPALYSSSRAARQLALDASRSNVRD